MSQNVIQGSFAAGELSPTLYGRVDLAKYHTGAALLRNFFVDYRGGASNRSGTRFIAVCPRPADKAVRLIPFQFSTLQTYILEFGDYYMRVYKDGGIVIDSFSNFYTLATPYPHTALRRLKFTQSADVMTIVHPDFPPYNLTRTDHDAWTITPVDFTPAIGAPSSVTTATSAAGTVGYSYLVTALDADGNESVASGIIPIYSLDLGTTTSTVTNSVSWTSVPGAVSYRVYKTYKTSVASSGTTTGANSSAQFGLVGATKGLRFDDTNIAPDYTVRPPTHFDPFGATPIESVTVTNGGSGYAPTDTLVISDLGGFGGVLFPIVVGGVIKSVVILSGGRDYLAPTITVTSGGGGTGATFSVQLGPAVGNNPSVVAYFEQRRVYANTLNEPQRFWMSQPGLFDNFDKSTPIKADDSITGVLASQQVNDIRSMISMPSGLITLTGGSAWQISGGQQGAALSPTTVTAKAQSYNGVSYIDPIVINYDILYVQALGSVVRDLSYNFFANVYTGADITVLSNHLFYGHTLVQWAYAEEPFKIVWAVRDDGRLLSLTFLKEQDVYGWAMHETRGLFMDVASIPEGTENAVYFVVKRYIRGEWIQYVERMSTRQFTSVEDAWFMDSALEYTLSVPGTGTLQAAAASGTGVNFNRNAGVFTTGDVGSIIRVGGGVGEITAFVDAQNVTADILVPITEILPISGIPLEAITGEWSMTPPVSTIIGLDHLEGETVGILGDGNVFTEAVVDHGSITVNHAVSRIIVGLPYSAKFQSLYLDTGDPTIQGKRKKIAALTARVEKTRGLKMGSTFDTLVEIKERTTELYGRPVQPITGDERLVMDQSWNSAGQVCIQQDYPLPCTVLAVIPEIALGDGK